MIPTKRIEYFENKPIHYRPNTSDEAIIQAVLIEKGEYIFPKFEPKIIFDIGANIGVVSCLLANLYPNSKIYAFEPVKENFDLLERNASYYENIFPQHYGLGEEAGNRRIYPSDVPSNLGGFSTHIKHGEGSLVFIRDVSLAAQEFGTPDLIKIDCEGAEDEILMALPNLEKVQWISGELHGVNDFKLLDDLSKNFELKLSKEFGHKNWHFHALNKSSPLYTQ